MIEPVVAMIMVMDRNRVIGKDGGLPWHIPSELAYFKKVTMGKPMIMGRKTHESIGRALPGRANIVVTRDPTWAPAEVPEATAPAGTSLEVVRSLEQAIESAGTRVLARPDLADHNDNREIMIIGGASICREAMPLTDKLYLTVIDKTFEGDTWLDSFVEAEWVEESSVEGNPEASAGLNLRYRVLRRAPVSA